MIDLGGKPSYFAEIDAQMNLVEPTQNRGIPVVPGFVADRRGIARVIGEMQAKALFIRHPEEGAIARHHLGPDAAVARHRCLTRMYAIIKPRAQRIIEGGEASVENDGGTGCKSDPFDQATDIHISLCPAGNHKFQVAWNCLMGKDRPW